MLTVELKARGRADYDGLPVNRARRPERARAAVAVAYEAVMESAATSLLAGQSVLIRGTPAIAPDFCAGLARKMGRQESQAFRFSSGVPANEAVRSFTGWDDRTLVHPVQEQLRDFQRNLNEHGQQNVIFVLDFLNTLFAGESSERANLLYLLAANSSQLYLGFASPAAPLPAALLDCFPIQLNIPPLAREKMWQLLAYDELQTLLSVQTLTVAHQIALYHALAGLDALRFRKIVDTLYDMSVAAASPFDVIDQVKEWLGFAMIADSPRPDGQENTLATLQEQVITPFRQYETAGSTAEVQQMDAIPHAILLVGETGETAQALALWLAGALQAQFRATVGAALNEAVALFSQAHPLPAVIFIDDFYSSFLAAGEPLRRFLAVWRTLPATWPIFIVAALPETRLLPAGVLPQFNLVCELR